MSVTRSADFSAGLGARGEVNLSLKHVGCTVEGYRAVGMETDWDGYQATTKSVLCKLSVHYTALTSLSGCFIKLRDHWWLKLCPSSKNSTLRIVTVSSQACVKSSLNGWINQCAKAFEYSFFTKMSLNLQLEHHNNTPFKQALGIAGFVELEVCLFPGLYRSDWQGTFSNKTGKVTCAWVSVLVYWIRSADFPQTV